MISFALMLMTLPSRMAGVRARLATASSSSGEHGESATGQPDRVGLPVSCCERSGCSGGCDGERLDKTTSAARDNASPARTGSYNKER